MKFQIGIFFYFHFYSKKEKKVILNVHDPKIHSGENDFSRSVVSKLMFSIIKNFVVFSSHGHTLLKEQVPENAQITNLKLLPFSIYARFLPYYKAPKEREYISFVSRISPYKGVDLFVEAIGLVHEKFPEQKFLISGKTIAGYNPSFLSDNNELLSVTNRFLSNTEIASIVNDSKVIVCPYKDATQSGVIMMAYALNTPVIVSDVGGLPEYVTHSKSGTVTDQPTARSLADSICKLLDRNAYLEMREYLTNDNLDKSYKMKNLKTVQNLYR